MCIEKGRKTRRLRLAFVRLSKLNKSVYADILLPTEWSFSNSDKQVSVVLSLHRSHPMPGSPVPAYCALPDVVMIHYEISRHSMTDWLVSQEDCWWVNQYLKISQLLLDCEHQATLPRHTRLSLRHLADTYDLAYIPLVTMGSSQKLVLLLYLAAYRR